MKNYAGPPAGREEVTQLFQKTEADEGLIRRSMVYMTIFRLILAIVILLVAFGDFRTGLDPDYKRFLAQATSLTYIIAAGVFAWFQWRPGFTPQELAQFSLMTDIVILLLVLHCFGGLGSGLVILLIFTAGIAGLLLRLQVALFFASLISIGIVVEAWLASGGNFANSQALQAGIYGIASFVTALGCSLLGRWGREYQLLAERRRNDLVGLEQVNDLIIRRMRSGVLVVDAELKVRQMNESAWYLLGNPTVSERRLKVIAPALVERLSLWRRTGRADDEGLLLKATQAAVIPQFVRLPGALGEATLIFLEDTSVVSRRARDLAQASLARLSASIAHEIRNPLGALSHASQLLGESDDLSRQDKRLIEIIRDHTSRMNDIVENVLRLSRRERAQIEQVDISRWLRTLAREFRAEHGLPEARLRLEAPRNEIQVLMDPGQLEQAVTNLMDNALRHAGSDKHQPTITLRLSPIRGHRELALDIIDDGPGIAMEKRSRIFEPFFSTHKQGSGLGLFLARQLCDANQAPLEYVQIPNSGACFRILIRRSESERPLGQPAQLANL
ncbi:MAG: ATP-binding protein [Wenzhouxiangellaceae bacterium]|nr:ATP-binding protein [Wenzhouxiangellaceae bacterium]